MPLRTSSTPSNTQDLCRRGIGWLFVAVKLLLLLVIVAIFRISINASPLPIIVEYSVFVRQ